MAKAWDTNAKRKGGPNLLGGETRALFLRLGDWCVLRAALEAFEQDQRDKLEELLAAHPELYLTVPAGSDELAQYTGEALGVADDIEDAVDLHRRVTKLFVVDEPNPHPYPSAKDTYNPMAGLPTPAVAPTKANSAIYGYTTPDTKGA